MIGLANMLSEIRDIIKNHYIRVVGGKYINSHINQVHGEVDVKTDNAAW